jgi:hypothetical protein
MLFQNTPSGVFIGGKARTYVRCSLTRKWIRKREEEENGDKVQ